MDHSQQTSQGAAFPLVAATDPIAARQLQVGRRSVHVMSNYQRKFGLQMQPVVA